MLSGTYRGVVRRVGGGDLELRFRNFAQRFETHRDQQHALVRPLGGAAVGQRRACPDLSGPQPRDRLWGAEPRRVSQGETHRERVGRIGNGKRERDGPADLTESGASWIKLSVQVAAHPTLYAESVFLY